MFDFSKSKVRKNGMVLDKFSLCQVIHCVSISKGYSYHSFLSYSLYPESYSYKECKEVLSFLLNL